MTPFNPRTRRSRAAFEEQSGFDYELIVISSHLKGWFPPQILHTLRGGSEVVCNWPVISTEALLRIVDVQRLRSCICLSTG